MAGSVAAEIDGRLEGIGVAGIGEEARSVNRAAT